MLLVSVVVLRSSEAIFITWNYFVTVLVALLVLTLDRNEQICDDFQTLCQLVIDQ